MEDEDGGLGGGPVEPWAGRFAVEVTSGGSGGAVVLAPSGELDHDTVGPFREVLDGHAGPVRVVVDCAGLGFCDSTGLNVLLKARARLLEEGGRLDLAALRPPVDRMFEITGAESVFRVYEDVGEALADPWPGDRS